MEFQEHPADGLIAIVTRGTKVFSIHLPSDDKGDTSDMETARTASKEKGVKVKSLKDVKSSTQEAAVKAKAKSEAGRISKVNAELKSLGARQIKSLEEIPNAQAFITIKRAQIFEEDEGK